MHSKIALALCLWFEKNARELPWRSNPIPYWVWLSEVMLQQTQVTTVLPYFAKFINKHPTVTSLASASIDEIYLLWAGLGYYSRARNLHRGAIAISKRISEGRGFPCNRSEWLEIPGVGEYTAGAICSIALEQPEAIVDGNVVRVLSRVFSIGKIDQKKTEIWEASRKLVQAKKTKAVVNPRALNQSMMELGALICRPKNPKCGECPISKFCSGKTEPSKYPPAKKKVIWKRIREEKWILYRYDREGIRLYLEQNEKLGWRQGLWDFPDAGIPKVLNAKLKTHFETRYTVTNHKISRVHTLFDLSKSRKVQSLAIKNGNWFLLTELPALPAPVKKAISIASREF